MIRPMSTPGAEAPGHRLSRDSIVDAYLRIADEEGADDVTLRRLGSELGVDATALYRHFRGKDELLSVASDRVLGEATSGLEATGSWRTDLRALLIAVRSAYMQHPKALRALQLTPASMPNASRLTERFLAGLRASGLDDDEIPIAFEALEDYTIGCSLFSALATEESLEGWRRVYGSESVEELPQLVAIAPRLYRDPDGAFAFGLDLMLDAIEARVREQGSPRGDGDTT
jgi:AcrR family transcriptional regulator